MTTVIEDRTPGQPVIHTMYTNGKFQGDDGEQQEAQMACPLIPALHLKERRRALVMGCGRGMSVPVLNGLDFETVDMAELSPGILLAAGSQFRHLNDDVLRSPRVKVHLDEGRNFVPAQSKEYDQITIELTNIWFAGATNVTAASSMSSPRAISGRAGCFNNGSSSTISIGPREIESIIGTLHASFP